MFNAANEDLNRVPQKPASTQRGFAVVQGHPAGRPARQSGGTWRLRCRRPAAPLLARSNRTSRT